MKTITKWVVKDSEGKEQIFESYMEAYDTYKELKETDEKVTVEKQEKYLLTE